jgi:hypothetical protein
MSLSACAGLIVEIWGGLKTSASIAIESRCNLRLIAGDFLSTEAACMAKFSFAATNILFVDSRHGTAILPWNRNGLDSRW